MATTKLSAHKLPSTRSQWMKPILRYMLNGGNCCSLLPGLHHHPLCSLELSAINERTHQKPPNHPHTPFATPCRPPATRIIISSTGSFGCCCSAKERVVERSGRPKSEPPQYSGSESGNYAAIYGQCFEFNFICRKNIKCDFKCTNVSTVQTHSGSDGGNNRLRNPPFTPVVVVVPILNTTMIVIGGGCRRIWWCSRKVEPFSAPRNEIISIPVVIYSLIISFY